MYNLNMHRLKYLFGIATLMSLTIVSHFISAQALPQNVIDNLTPEQKAQYDYVLDLINNPNPVVNPNTGLPQGIQEDFKITINPEIPDPNEPVFISIESFSTNLQTSQIEWREDGYVVLSGINETQFQTIAPEAGVTKTIVLTVTKQNGGEIQKTITFSTADVHLLYQPLTYTPPFYKGAPIFTSQSRVILSAIPYFVVGTNILINPKDLIYNWKIDGQNIPSSSGIGKDVATYDGVLIQRPTEISVEVSTIDGVIKAKDSVVLSLNNPEVILYENNPLYGTIFEKAVSGTFSLDRGEIELGAQPYFFNTTALNDILTNFQWYANNELQQTTTVNNLRFRGLEGENVRAEIGVIATRNNFILQNASAEVQIDFTESASDFNF